MHFKISCLLFIRNFEDKLLMLKRNKPPNLGLWSPPGGKLGMDSGESPVECAQREAMEETGLILGEKDLELFGYVSEKGYEGTGHWLMFLFDCKKPISQLPESFDEGSFAFFERDEIKLLSIPESDHELIWPYYDKRDDGVWGLRADWMDGKPNIMIESKPK
jgi:8-oxo-dGTP diphosphatase